MRAWMLPSRSRRDLVIAAIGLVLCEIATWVRTNPIGTAVAGPAWLRAAYPVLLAAPLLWRRVAPFAAFAVMMFGIALQALVTRDSPEGVELMYTVGIGIYAVGLYCTRRTAAAGLIIGVLTYGVYALENKDARTGQAGELWATAFFAVALVAIWLAGVFVRNRHEERRISARAAELERQARTAVADERIRLARELHDVVAHNLSVVVLQAAGARAAGQNDPSTLEKIERSGRESLVEMRRLLGVLRREGDDAALAPQPGVSDIEDLVERVRAAGIPVDLTIDEPSRALGPALDASVYRIVQEALTNVLKHAGPARATVTVSADTQAITIDVIDDGGGSSSRPDGGHGLIGMRERVGLFKGELTAGPQPGRGFAVHARLLRDDARSP